jgi:hypothetical protein
VLETRTATLTPEQLRASLSEDPAFLAQAKANAQALDFHNPVNPNSSGHSNKKHGEQTIGMSPQERRLRTGIPRPRAARSPPTVFRSRRRDSPSRRCRLG